MPSLTFQQSFLIVAALFAITFTLLWPVADLILAWRGVCVMDEPHP